MCTLGEIIQRVPSFSGHELLQTKHGPQLLWRAITVVYDVCTLRHIFWDVLVFGWREREEKWNRVVEFFPPDAHVPLLPFTNPHFLFSNRIQTSDLHVQTYMVSHTQMPALSMLTYIKIQDIFK